LNYPDGGNGNSLNLFVTDGASGDRNRSAEPAPVRRQTVRQ